MKKSLYPKTKRIGNSKKPITITEKLDGSNIGFFRYNDDLLIATRNNIFKYSEIDDHKELLYKGMFDWLESNAGGLIESLHPNSGFFGEWIGMGVLKYPDFDKKVYMFAKVNITKDLDIKNLYYSPDLFIYPFVEQKVPDFIGFVPVIEEMSFYPNIAELDTLYDEYKETVGRNVEGFIINNADNIRKYVRMKNGKLTSHRS